MANDNYHLRNVNETYRHNLVLGLIYNMYMIGKGGVLGGVVVK